MADPISDVELPAGTGFPDVADTGDEEWLLVALREGRETAYEVLLDRFQQSVYSLVYRLVADPADVPDIVQEVFLKVFRNIGHFRGQSSLKTWVYRITLNEAHNRQRWFRRHRHLEVGLEAGDPDARNYLDTIPDPNDSPYDYVLNREKRALIEQALRSLKPSFRAAVVLRDLEDLSYEEVAEIMGTKMGTVKTRILRGREALRKQLAGRLEPQHGYALSPQPVE